MKILRHQFDILLLGLAPQGLFLLREYCRAGKKVVAVGLKDQVGNFSKYGKKYVIEEFGELDVIFTK